MNTQLPKLQGFWIDRSTVAVPTADMQSGWGYRLTYAGGSGLISLTPLPDGLTAMQRTRFPQLAGYGALRLGKETADGEVVAALRSDLALTATDGEREPRYATGLQTAGVLDDLFYWDGPLGVTFARYSITIRLWAPTAQSVKLLLFAGANDRVPEASIPMSEVRGVWRVEGEPSWVGKYYLLSVRVYVASLRSFVENVVTDPYSLDLALNGSKTRITDLGSELSKPVGWDEHRSPSLDSKNDLSIYELHVRDFSSADESVPEHHRGTYLAFADPKSSGMRHLAQLADAGLKAIHLLPTFHFASVNEDKSTWKSAGDLSGFASDSEEQQARIAHIQNSDAYNWGYDPVHYFAPAGAYACDPNQRVKEYREMVMCLHATGLRVIQDVVFNHTNSSGQASTSVLDKIVPNYYHRLDADGNVVNSSCCADTASEHKMVAKLMLDCVVQNARAYRIDGFRFDLMGFHLLSNMQRIQEALAALTLEEDSVDGSKLYVYGEGWNFGEARDNQLGPNASQVNIYATGIGVFNDRIRDAIRGGSPFDEPRVQGFATGLLTAPSVFTNETQSLRKQRAELLKRTDWIRAGLAGNLRDYSFEIYTGEIKRASEIDYAGQGVGYTASPVENVNYCSVHDNHTLFDAVQLKSAIPGTTSSGGDDVATRTRRQILAMSLIALGQGIPFFQAGDDLLRSKDMDGNSYDSGDWFNKVDFSYQSANWGIGLPVASENRGNWSIMRRLLKNSDLSPGPANIEHARKCFAELLRLRESSRLFRMQTLGEVQKNLQFLNTGARQKPGLIVMRLDAKIGNYGPYNRLVAVFNGRTETVTFHHGSLKELMLHLHPIQAASYDAVVRGSNIDGREGTVTVPALTTAVFVSEH